ncbi:MAG: hypothetical protein AMXMBFR4_10440 [Candidatus Hydrogenedentota bacterium]
MTNPLEINANAVAPVPTTNAARLNRLFFFMDHLLLVLHLALQAAVGTGGRLVNTAGQTFVPTSYTKPDAPPVTVCLSSYARFTTGASSFAARAYPEGFSHIASSIRRGVN